MDEAKIARKRLVTTFGGGGGGAGGMQQAKGELYGQRAEFELVGSFDKDHYACEAFKYLTGVEQVCIDARELTPALMREFFGDQAPFTLHGSPPCVGYSKLLSSAKSKMKKYQLFNELALVNTRLILETWPGDLPAFILYENVPNITSRGKELLVEVRRLLKAAGYVLQDGFHECRHVGNLAQRRKRWFLVARHPKKVPAFLYLPPRRPGLVCGDVLNELPMPGDPAGGPMHKLPAISALNWWRLWAIPAGGDWRDLLPDDGTPRRARFRRHHIEHWTEPSVTIGGSGTNGPCGVADPRQGASPAPLDIQPQRGNGRLHYDKYAVRPWNKEALTVHGATRVGSGAQSIAQPITAKGFRECWGVLSPEQSAGTVTGNARTATGAFNYAAPLPLVPEKKCFDKAYAVIDRDREPSHTIAGVSDVGCGTYAITDDVPGPERLRLELGCPQYAGSYGVIGSGEPSPTVTASSHIDKGAVAIADPKPARPPFVVLSYEQAKLVADGYITAPFAIVDPERPDEPLAIVEDMAKPPFRWVETRGKASRRKVIVPLVLISADGTWHRPLTTLELAVLQGLRWKHNGRPLDFGGGSTKQRELIGNMVPSPVGMAMGEQMLIAGIAADQNCFFLTNGGAGIWVREEDRERLERAGVQAIRQQDLHLVPEGAVVILDDRARRRTKAPQRSLVGAPNARCRSRSAVSA